MKIVASPRNAGIQSVNILAAWWLLGREVLQNSVKLFDEAVNLLVLVADLLGRKILKTGCSVRSQSSRYCEGVGIQGLSEGINGTGSWWCETTGDSFSLF